jgi:TolB-like protein/DNA-binding winged helix-turn-helix (wHTH) protein
MISVDRRFRFGVFEVDVKSGELSKQGRRIKLQEKPFQTLVLLLERAGDLVTREELRERLWPADTFVQFDDNLNTTIKRVREALGDSATSSRFVETVPRRGYRFLGPVEVLESPVEIPAPARSKMPARWLAFGAIAAVVVCVAAWLLLTRQHVSAKAPAATKIRLAVLPFLNLSGDANQDYISDGMTEELIAQLGRMAPTRLGVIARTSVTRYKKTTTPIGEIGRQLDVEYVLEGSVRRAGERINATAQLIQVRDGTHLWSETYERPFADLFGVQRDVARRIAQSLAIQLLPAQETALARASTATTAAYEAFLNGMFELHRGTRQSFEAALGHFSEAVRLDPNYAMAYNGVASTNLELADYHFIPEADGVSRADEAVKRALALDGSIPTSHILQAEVLRRSSRDDRAIEAAYRRALELNPSHAQGHRDYADWLIHVRRGDQAIAEMNEAVKLDPFSASQNTYLAWLLFLDRRNGESLNKVKRALAIDPEYPFALYVWGHLDEAGGQTRDALAHYEHAVTASGRTPKYLNQLAVACIKAGQRERARKLLDELREQSKTQYVPAEYIERLSKQL